MFSHGCHNSLCKGKDSSWVPLLCSALLLLSITPCPPQHFSQTQIRGKNTVAARLGCNSFKIKTTASRADLSSSHQNFTLRKPSCCPPCCRWHISTTATDVILTTHPPVGSCTVDFSTPRSGWGADQKCENKQLNSTANRLLKEEVQIASVQRDDAWNAKKPVQLYYECVSTSSFCTVLALKKRPQVTAVHSSICSFLEHYWLLTFINFHLINQQVLIT